MKAVFFATVFAVAATQSMATGMTEALVDPEVVMAPEEVATGAAGSGGFVIPLVLLAIVAVVAGGGGGGDVAKVPDL